MKRKRPLLAATLALVGLVALAAAAVALAAGHKKTLYVSPHGHDRGACTRRAPCKTITHAVARAARGDTIVVGAGTYKDGVVLDKKLNLVGVGKPTVNATGKTNGFAISSAGAGSTIRDFRVKNAIESGIAATSTSHVAILNNTIVNNDKGVGKPTASGFCQGQGQAPGDCGEGIHLVGTTHSRVQGNLVQGNSGGILLSDETGPTAFNAITRNRVKGNLLDCGITLAGHNPGAVTLTGPPAPDKGTPAPSVAGVYNNVISGNNVVGNGLRTPGAGIQMAGGPPGAAVYNNVVKGNTITDNGHPGVTLHSHAPGQDFNGNKVLNNTVNRNAINGDDTAGLTQTVGILLFSSADHLTGIVVKGNTVRDDHFGIWTQNAPPIAKSANTFKNVKVPLTQK